MAELLRKLKRRFTHAIREVERRSLLHQARRAQRSRTGLYGEVVGITLVSCIILIALEFYGGSHNWTWMREAAGWLNSDWKSAIDGFFSQGKYSRLHQLGYWATCTFLGYMLVPMLWVRFAMDRSLAEMGLSLKGFFRHAWIYALLFALVLPLVYAVSGTQSFQNTYPFYGNAGRSLYDFLAWELLYAVQFMSLEFFFRGFLVHGLKRRFGFYAIFVSVIPYCMIHFGKPLPEALGSVVAGLTLGIFSLFTGSIWLGVLIHISVAVSMDVFALA